MKLWDASSRDLLDTHNAYNKQDGFLVLVSSWDDKKKTTLSCFDVMFYSASKSAAIEASPHGAAATTLRAGGDAGTSMSEDSCSCVAVIGSTAVIADAEPSEDSKWIKSDTRKDTTTSFTHIYQHAPVFLFFPPSR